MSDEDQVVDGLTPNGVNVFTSPKLGLALAVKQFPTAGDLDRWLSGVAFSNDALMITVRNKLLYGAARAGLIIQSTDPIPNEQAARDLPGEKAQWYGDQLWSVYRRYTTVDPN